MERLSSPKLNRNMNTAGANESSRAPTNIRLRILEPSTRLRWSASNFTMFRKSRTSSVSSSRNAITESAVKQEDLARAVGAQKWRQGVEGIQRSQHQQKQEHASAERYDRTPAVLGFCCQRFSVCLTDYSAGQNPAPVLRERNTYPSGGKTQIMFCRVYVRAKQAAENSIPSGELDGGS